MQRCFAVIMAGGSGTRFWPLSRRKQPKQLLDLFGGGKPLLTATLERLRGLIEPDNTIVVTDTVIAEEVRKAAPSVPVDNIFREPAGRNTAPCIGWAALHVRRKDPEGVMAVLPADHHIGNVPTFRTVLGRAMEAASEGRIVTVGVRPTRPDTGYGYLKLGDRCGRHLLEVLAFVEKPDLRTAKRYLRQGTYAWNSGMFFFMARRILEEIEHQMPDLFSGLRTIDAAIGTDRAASVLNEVFPTLPSISIDYGVMEKAEGIAAVQGDFDWSDVGSWEAAYELSDHDRSGNSACESDTILIQSSGCLARAASGKLVALVGLEDVVVIDTDDALLVCRRDKSQDVRKIVDELKSRKRKDLL